MSKPAFVPSWQRGPSLNDLARERRAIPKHEIIPRQLVKEAKVKAKKDKDQAFRDAIWTRDGGKSRATGKPLGRSGMNWDEIGEVDHVINRSTAPDRVYDESNGILLSKRENRLKKTPCPRAPEHHMFEVSGPDDRSKPQRFVWRDLDGNVTRRTVG